MGEKKGETIIEVQDLRKYYPLKTGLVRRQVGVVKAVDGVSFSIRMGETLGLVGESGCGKTTTGRLLVRAFPPTGGHIFYGTDDKRIDIAILRGEALQDYRRKAQLIFQDPYTSLNPRQTVMQIISEPLLCLAGMSDPERRDSVRELLQVVGLDPRYANRYPHAFSGGQRQRIGIARALAIQPQIIVADEAVSALDVSIQAQIINLLEELQERYKLTFLFITHDLSVVYHISDRVAVMYVGKVVELAEKDSLFFEPCHPYTEALLSSLPHPEPTIRFKRVILEGDVADPANRPPGCPFHPRCRYAREHCRIEEPQLRNLSSKQLQHLVACHFAEELSLQGVPESG